MLGSSHPAPKEPNSHANAGLAKEYGFSWATVYRAREMLREAIAELGSEPREPSKRWSLAE
jgi:hypothetical protein